MFQLDIRNMKHDEQLQIVQADVSLHINGELWIEEPLCIDVGLPSLLYSGLYDIEPDRFASAQQWQNHPFFVCGCGDPECRAFAIRVRHLNQDELELIEVEQTTHGEIREYGRTIVSKQSYRQQIIEVAHQFITYMQGKDYRSLHGDILSRVKQLVSQLKEGIENANG